jgi:hypothetical protein
MLILYVQLEKLSAEKLNGSMDLNHSVLKLLASELFYLGELFAAFQR